MLINGEFRDSLDSTDRGLAYGDGLFETIRLHAGKPVLLEEHLKRLLAGTERLAIPLNVDLLLSDIKTILEQAPAQAVLKITVTRGCQQGRGYRPGRGTNAETPNRILAINDLPGFQDEETSGVEVFLCRHKLALQPALAGIKHLNRLEQVLASMEWPGEQFAEGIMFNTQNMVVEGTRSNVFFGKNGVLHTPDLSACGVEGVMRNHLLRTLDVNYEEGQYTLNELKQADEVFICNSVFGVWPVSCLYISDASRVYYKAGEFCQKAISKFHQLIN